MGFIYENFNFYGFSLIVDFYLKIIRVLFYIFHVDKSVMGVKY